MIGTATSSVSIALQGKSTFLQFSKVLPSVNSLNFNMNISQDPNPSETKSLELVVNHSVLCENFSHSYR